MKVTVHAEGSAKDIAGQLAQHATVYLNAAKTETTPIATDTTKATRGKKAKAEEPTFDPDADMDDDAEESDDATLGDDEGDADAEDTATHDEVVAAFKKYAKKHGQDKAVAKLNKLGYKSITKIQPEMRANVIAAVRV